MAGARNEAGVEVSVVIPALEATPHVLNIVRLLALQEQPFPFEVLLVLNHAPREIGVELPPRVRILFCETPGSFAARNAGIAQARGRVLTFMDADVTPHANWMSEGLEAVRQLGFRRMVAGAVIPFHERRSPVGIYEGAFYFRQDAYVERGFAGPANFWVPRMVVDAIGRFDEGLFAVSAQDFCRRAAAAGFGLAFAQDAIVYHPTRSGFADLMQRERRAAGARLRLAMRDAGAPVLGLDEEIHIFRDRRRYLKEHYSGWSGLSLQVIAVSSLIVRVAERLAVFAGKRPMAH